MHLAEKDKDKDKVKWVSIEREGLRRDADAAEVALGWHEHHAAHTWHQPTNTSHWHTLWQGLGIHSQESSRLEHLAVGPVDARVAVAGVDHLRARLPVESRRAPDAQEQDG